MKIQSYQTRRLQTGQALVEWAVFGVAVLGLWVSSMQLAKRLLTRVAADSWSVQAARHTLSKVDVQMPAGMQLHTSVSRRRGTRVQANVEFGGAASAKAIAIPALNQGSLLSSSSSFGLLSSLFSE